MERVCCSWKNRGGPRREEVRGGCCPWCGSYQFMVQGQVGILLRGERVQFVETLDVREASQLAFQYARLGTISEVWSWVRESPEKIGTYVP